MKKVRASKSSGPTSDPRHGIGEGNGVDDVAGDAPEGASDDGGEPSVREVFRAFAEASALLAKVLVRWVGEAGRPEAIEPDFHFHIEEEMEALKRHKKQTQEIIGHLQSLKKLIDMRLKGLRGLQDWVRTPGD